MNFKSILLGGSFLSFLFVASSCGNTLDNENKENPASKPEETVTAQFAVPQVSVPVNGTETVELVVTPADRAKEVIVTIAEESVVGIEKTEYTDKGVTLTLKAQKLSSTTIYAIHDDLDTPAECEVTVTPIGVEGITLDKTSLELKVFETYTLSPTITPADATSPVITWKSDNEAVATVDGGIVTAVSSGEATVTASCNGKTAECKVSVSAVYATSLSLSVDGKEISEKKISINERFKVDALILPETVTYKTVEWTVENVEDGKEAAISCEPIYIDGNTASAYVTAVKAGKSRITAKITDGTAEGAFSASIEVSTQQPARPSANPKIGDYFYSDGTWSDGGLVSINEDGTGAVWLTGLEKPAPDPDKTVIGIVFQTDTSRISSTERALGYTHGLVFCLKAAFAPISPYPTTDHRLDSLTRYSMSSTSAIANLVSHKSSTECYNDINGYSINQTILSRYPKGSDDLKQYPAFDWVHTDFAPAAPAGTSGWYIPSSGQIWDFVVNLCGDEVASNFSFAKDGSVDLYRIDSYYNMKFSFNPVEKLNSYWALVPLEMKHNLKYSRNSGESYRICELMTSSLYQNSDSETQCIIYWMSASGELMPFPGHTDDSIVCHPVLSF